jgi:hypothetical protein
MALNKSTIPVEITENSVQEVIEDARSDTISDLKSPEGTENQANDEEEYETDSSDSEDDGKMIVFN